MDKPIKQVPLNGNGGSRNAEQHQELKPDQNPAAHSKVEQYSGRKPIEQQDTASKAKEGHDPLKSKQHAQAAQGDDDLMSQEPGHQGPSPQRK